MIEYYIITCDVFVAVFFIPVFANQNNRWKCLILCFHCYNILCMIVCNCVFCDISAIIVQQLTRRCMGSSHSPYLHRCRQLRPRREMVSVAWFTAQISDSEPKHGYYRSTSTLMKTLTWNSNPYKKYNLIVKKFKDDRLRRFSQSWCLSLYLGLLNLFYYATLVLV